MNKPFGKDIRLQTACRGIPDAHSAFRAYPSFPRRVEEYFIHVSFRQFGAGTREMTDFLSVFETIHPVRSAYPQATFRIGTNAEHVSAPERIRVTRIEIAKFQGIRVEHVHASAVSAYIISSLEIAAGYDNACPQLRHPERLETMRGFINEHETVARADEFLASVKGNGAHGHVFGGKTGTVTIDSEHIVLKKGVVHSQLIETYPKQSLPINQHRIDRIGTDACLVAYLMAERTDNLFAGHRDEMHSVPVRTHIKQVFLVRREGGNDAAAHIDIRTERASLRIERHNALGHRPQKHLSAH